MKNPGWRLAPLSKSAARLALLAGAALASVSTMAAPLATLNAPPAAVTQEAPRPNILFVLVDDMGFADLSVMGNPKIETPNIDRLAREGILMTRFYDAAPICSPSRAGFFTGRFPAEIGFVNYISDRQYNRDIGQVDWLDPELPNVARMLQDAGYVTGHFGKWHMGGGRDVGDAPWPTAYGFDESFTTAEGLGPRVLVSDAGRHIAEQSALLGQGPFFWEVKRKLTELYCDKTIDFVTRHKDQPWFVQLWLNDVHDAWAPSEQDLAAVRGKGTDAEDEKYLAAILGMDRALGKLFDKLETMGEARDTLIVLTSDNGPSSLPRFYRDGSTAPGSVDGLRGRKWSNYEGGIRQPLIVRWPGHVRAGVRDERSVGHGVDLMPTLARAAGVPLPVGADGIDLMPALTGTPIEERPALFWAYGKAGAVKRPPQPAQAKDAAPLYAMREGKWKLLADPGRKNVQLYDLEAEPGEMTNLAASFPAVRDAMLAQLDAWIGTLPQ